MTPSLRNRIVRHVRVRAGELVPHELNPRRHPQAQRAALQALYRQVGFARSLLAFQLPDGRLKLIDGHLRAEMTPDQEVEVEVLDLEEEEARVLLLSLDPLAGLAETDQEALDRLRRLTSTESDDLANLWQSLGATARAVEEELERARRPEEKSPGEQYLILVECASETEQTQLLQRLGAEGIRCRALLS